MKPMQLPSPVRIALETLERAGFEGFVVGGCVRDHLMGLVPHDFDITTNAHPQQIKRCFAPYPTIDTGLAHGTVTVVIDRMPLEITTYRLDGDYRDHRHPDTVTFTPHLAQDLSRRDFTVNAMAYSPTHGLIDPFGGQADLRARCIRCVGDPYRRFEEDALRILRALRFCAVLCFPIESKTAAALCQKAETLRAVSVERIYAELCKLVCGAGAHDVLMRYASVVRVFLPALAACIDDHPAKYRNFLDVLFACPPILPLRLAALFGGAARDAQNAGQAARQALLLLHADNATVDLVARLAAFKGDLPVSMPQARRLLRRFPPQEIDLVFALERARALAENPTCRMLRLRSIARAQSLVEAVLLQHPCLHVRDLAVSGHDVMAAGFSGRAIGQALSLLLEAVTDERVCNERGALLAYLCEHSAFSPIQNQSQS